MRIIEWNCQGAFRNKNKEIFELNPDILIIPECEQEEKLKFGKLTPKPNDFIWYGAAGKKGIGIFSYSNYRFKILKEFNPEFRYIIPIIASNKENSFLLFAIWAMNNKENHYRDISDKFGLKILKAKYQFLTHIQTLRQDTCLN